MKWMALVVLMLVVTAGCGDEVAERSNQTAESVDRGDFLGSSQLRV